MVVSSLKGIGVVAAAAVATLEHRAGTSKGGLQLVNTCRMFENKCDSNDVANDYE